MQSRSGCSAALWESSASALGATFRAAASHGGVQSQDSRRAGAFSGPSPGADTCSWAASRARLGREGEGNRSDDSQRTGLLLSCTTNSIRQLLEKKEAGRQHCHRIPGVNERKLKPYFHWVQADDWKNVSLFTGT